MNLQEIGGGVGRKKQDRFTSGCFFDGNHAGGLDLRLTVAALGVITYSGRGAILEVSTYGRGVADRKERVVYDC